MRYEHYMIAERPTKTGDGMGGFTTSTGSVIYADKVDVQDVSTQHASNDGTLTSRGRAKVFLNTLFLDTSMQQGDKVTFYWRGLRDILVDENGEALWNADNDALSTVDSIEEQGGRVESFRNLDDKLMVKFSSDRSVPVAGATTSGGEMQTQAGDAMQTQAGSTMEQQE